MNLRSSRLYCGRANNAFLPFSSLKNSVHDFIKAKARGSTAFPASLSALQHQPVQLSLFLAWASETLMQIHANCKTYSRRSGTRQMGSSCSEVSDVAIRMLMLLALHPSPSTATVMSSALKVSSSIPRSPLSTVRQVKYNRNTGTLMSTFASILHFRHWSHGSSYTVWSPSVKSKAYSQSGTCGHVGNLCAQMLSSLRNKTGHLKHWGGMWIYVVKNLYIILCISKMYTLQKNFN